MHLRDDTLLFFKFSKPPQGNVKTLILTRVSAWLITSRKILRAWRERSRQRRALAELSPYLLKDIGISRSDAINEVNKPFWER